MQLGCPIYPRIGKCHTGNQTTYATNCQCDRIFSNKRFKPFEFIWNTQAIHKNYSVNDGDGKGNDQEVHLDLPCTQFIWTFI